VTCAQEIIPLNGFTTTAIGHRQCCWCHQIPLDVIWLRKANFGSEVDDAQTFLVSHPGHRHTQLTRLEDLLAVYFNTANSEHGYICRQCLGKYIVKALHENISGSICLIMICCH